MKTQIPIYRAKVKENSDKCIKENTYIVGYLTKNYGTEEYFIEGKIGDSNSIFVFRVDPSTLAIHFSSMIANDSYSFLSNGEADLKIFASLSEDGKGGDKLDLIGSMKDGYAVLLKGVLAFVTNHPYKEVYGIHHWGSELKVTGIKEQKQ